MTEILANKCIYRMSKLLWVNIIINTRAAIRNNNGYSEQIIIMNLKWDSNKCHRIIHFSMNDEINELFHSLVLKCWCLKNNRKSLKKKKLLIITKNCFWLTNQRVYISAKFPNCWKIVNCHQQKKNIPSLLLQSILF